MSLSLGMLYICPSAARLTSCSPTNPWHLLTVCFVFLPPLTMVQLSWRPRLAHCFFPWKMAGMGFLAARAAFTSDHLLQPMLLPSPEPEQLLHAPEGSGKAGITLLLACARSPELQPHQLALRARLLLLEASAAGLCWFMDPAVTAKGGCWCNSCHIRDDCHKNTAAEKKAVSLSIRLLQLLKSGGWVRVHASLQREDSSLLQKEEIECYLSKLGMLYANNYMVQSTF